jgi:hypothetical protein
MIQAGGETSQCEIHKLINSVCRKEELPDEKEELNIVAVHKKGIKTD